MFERFTDRSRKVMALANQEAQRFNHEYIGTEHILLGLLKEGSGVGANVLKNLDVDLRKVRLEVEKLVRSGPDIVTMGKLPQTPASKRATEYAIEEARNLNHNYVGTEHLLLGLIREHDGVAAHVLLNLNLKLEDVRAEVLNLLGAGRDEPPLPFDRSRDGTGTLIHGGGVLVILSEGCGFLVRSERASPPCPGPIYVSPSLIRRFGLRSGQVVKGAIRAPAGAEQFHTLVAIEFINGDAAVAPPVDPIASSAPPSDRMSMPTRLAEAWVRVAIGAILLCMMPNLFRCVLSAVDLSEPPLPMRDGTPYPQSGMVLPDAGVAAYAGVLIVGGLIYLLAPRRDWLTLLAVLTAAVVTVNLSIVAVEWNSGFLFVNALAVAFGGYQFIQLLGDRSGES
jgi:hypothetical protein